MNEIVQVVSALQVDSAELKKQLFEIAQELQGRVKSIEEKVQHADGQHAQAGLTRGSSGVGLAPAGSAATSTDQESGNSVSRGSTRPQGAQDRPSSGGFDQVDMDSLQHKFKSVKDAYASVKLPEDLYFSGRQQGIEKGSRESATILSGAATYGEAALKVTSSLQELYGESDQLDDLTIILVAFMRFLQERHAGLVVAGTYGPKAKQLFDSIGAGNSSIGHPQILQRVETVAKLTAFRP